MHHSVCDCVRLRSVNIPCLLQVEVCLLSFLCQVEVYLVLCVFIRLRSVLLMPVPGRGLYNILSVDLAGCSLFVILSVPG